jgi:hypothetical protein
MDLIAIISELRREIAKLDVVIAQLDHLARTSGKQGRKRRKPFSTQTRQRMAAAQKRRWAAYRKAKLEKRPPADQALA